MGGEAASILIMEGVFCVISTVYPVNVIVTEPVNITLKEYITPGERVGWRDEFTGGINQQKIII
jgi:hypothetical protein